MRKKLARYLLLSLSSFSFFTLVFHTAVYAETVADTDSRLFSVTQIPPTPTLLPEKTIQQTSQQTLTPQPSPTPAATETPTPTPTATPTPTDTPTPTPIVTVTPTPQTPVQLSTGGGLNADVLFDMSNAYRAERGLTSFQKDSRLCELAASRAPEIAGEVASGALHRGLQARNYPYGRNENIISMNSEQAAFNWWVNDPIHHDAIVGNFAYSCVACSGNSCAQEFANF